MTSKYKIWIIFSLLAVFALGIAAGILGEKSLKQRRPPRSERSSDGFPAFMRMAEEIGLTEEQKQELQAIFRKNEERLKEYNKNVRSQLAEIREKLKNEIDSVLTPEQKKKLDELIQKYRQERRKKYEERREKTPSRLEKSPPRNNKEERQ